jgi:quinohemoprotein ethanol dehydrogenase
MLPSHSRQLGGTLNFVSARIAWQKRMPYSIGQGSGALVTASDLLFHGEPDGHFQAYDARNGELLWQWQTGAGADAPAITSEIDGVQYLTIAAGGLATQTASTNGDMVWAFSLKGSPNDRIAQFEAPAPPPTGVTFDFTGLVKGGVPIEKTNAVRMIDYNFNPPRITVETGSKVSFTNSGSQPHNAAGADASAGDWDTGMLSGGETATVTFNRPGTYNYTCTPHPFMIGQIIVTGEAAAPHHAHKTLQSSLKSPDRLREPNTFGNSVRRLGCLLKCKQPVLSLLDALSKVIARR